MSDYGSLTGAEVEAAHIVEEASRSLVVDLTSALAEPWHILYIRKKYFRKLTSKKSGHYEGAGQGHRSRQATKIPIR